MASAFLISAVALLASFTAAEDARIRSEDSIPDWASGVALGMTFSTDGGDDAPYQYFVVPLTTTADDDQSGSQSVGSPYPIQERRCCKVNRQRRMRIFVTVSPFTIAYLTLLPLIFSNFLTTANGLLHSRRPSRLRET